MDNKIPAQHDGGHSDTVSKQEFNTADEAKTFFETVKARFLNVNQWELFAGKEKTEFAMMTASGEILYREPAEGDFFRINIPGPNNPSGDKYDWVQVEEKEHKTLADEESIMIRVRPCPSPLNAKDETAHFFSDDATSTFIVKREGNVIFAEVHGRNEKPNTENLGVVEKIRNTLVAIGGILGGSKFQWKSLTEGLLKTDVQ